MLQSFIRTIRLFFKNRTKVQLMSRFLISVLCIFAFSLTSFYVMGTLLTDKFNESNQLIVDTVTKSLNEAFKKIDDVYKKMENLNETKSIFRENGVIFSDSDTMLGTASEIGNTILQNDFIEEIIFLKKDSPMLMTSQGGIDKEEFFNRKYNSELYGTTFFDNIITDYLSVKVIPATSYKNLVKYPTEDPKRLFAFVKTVPSNDMNIILFLSEERFLKATNLDSLSSKIRLKIYDQNDSVIFSNTLSNFMINTAALPKDYSGGMINRSFEKYYVIKSSYNYFYYVAQTDNVILLAYLTAFLLLILGLFVAIYLLFRKISAFYQLIQPAYEELQIDEEYGSLQELGPKLIEMKGKLKDQFFQIDSISSEIKNSLFFKIVSSSSYYGKNKAAADLTFAPVIDCVEYILLSVDCLQENIKYPRFETELVMDLLHKNNIVFVQIEEGLRKNLFLLGASNEGIIDLFLNQLEECLSQLPTEDLNLLISFSKEFKDFSGLYDAYGDIKICRDYRGVNDKISILTPKKIVYGSNLFLPVNFKDELTGRIMGKDEGGVKEYIRNVFEINIKNNVPVIKFEYLLRIMQNTIIEALSVVKKDSADLFELEQFFMKRVESLKDEFDPEGIINSFINLLHLSISLFDTKKSMLNRSDVIKYINSKYHEDLYLERIATKFGTTAKYFSNYFKKEFLIGFNEYLTQVRISHAKEILAKTELSIAEVGEKVGYSNQATFAVAFKKNVGIPPGKYREINKAAK